MAFLSEVRERQAEIRMNSEQPIDIANKPGHEPTINRFFRAAIKTQASDVHLKIGQPAKLRLYGRLKNTTGEVFST